MTRADDQNLVNIVPPAITDEAFGQYLKSRNIAADKLSERLPAVYTEWLQDFMQMSPDSFWSRHRNTVNHVRRQLLGLQRRMSQKTIWMR